MEKFELAKKLRQKQEDELAFKRRDTIRRLNLTLKWINCEYKVLTIFFLPIREPSHFAKGAGVQGANNPFSEIEEEEDLDEDVNENSGFTIPEWLSELPDDLEVTKEILLH